MQFLFQFQKVQNLQFWTLPLQKSIWSRGLGLKLVFSLVSFKKHAYFKQFGVDVKDFLRLSHFETFREIHLIYKFLHFTFVCYSIPSKFLLIFFKNTGVLSFHDFTIHDPRKFMIFFRHQFHEFLSISWF